MNIYNRNICWKIIDIDLYNFIYNSNYLYIIYIQLLDFVQNLLMLTFLWYKMEMKDYKESSRTESSELLPKEKDRATRIAVTAGIVLAVAILATALGLVIWKITVAK